MKRALRAFAIGVGLGWMAWAIHALATVPAESVTPRIFGSCVGGITAGTLVIIFTMPVWCFPVIDRLIDLWDRLPE